MLEPPLRTKSGKARFASRILTSHGARASAYAEHEPYTKLLLGTEYALLRGEFRAHAGRSSQVRPRCRNLLVTMGGSDLENVMGKVLGAVAESGIPELEIRAIVGSGNPHLAALKEIAGRSAPAMRLEIEVADMAELMRWADLAITAAGSTVWELAAMGVPMLLLPVVEHQVPIAEAMHALGAGVNLGWHADGVNARLVSALADLEAPDRRQLMRDISRRLVDGKGAERVVAAMRLAEKP
jgi:spore coat polysaccharide biosynthesis predicted glycosyltransferase SpsG